MYRLLIVDDEPYVVDWLSGLIEAQPDIDLDICRAYSATEALNWLNRAKIDILITDICMPDMSGITLIEKVRQNWPDCKVIMLTAHADFDYAYEAIKNDAISYILKTEDDDRILTEVGKAIGFLDNELKNTSLMAKVQEQLKASMSIMQKEFLFGLLKGEYCINDDIFEQFQNMDIGIAADIPFLLLIGRIENLLQGITVVEKFQLINSVKKIAQHYLEKNISCFPIEYEYNKMVWILQPLREGAIGKGGMPDTDFMEYSVIFTKGMLETIQKSCKETLDTDISFTMNSNLIQLEQLQDKFRFLDQLLNYHVMDKNGFIVTDTAFTDSINKAEIPLEPGLEKIRIKLNAVEKLKSCLEKGQKKEFMAELKEICEELRKVKSRNNNTALEVYYSIALVIISYINNRKLTEKVAFKIGINELLRPYSGSSWSDVVDYLYQLVDVVFDLQVEDNTKLSNDMIQFIKEYIRNHFTEDVSLIKLSEVTGYNGSYISRFFKELTGETLNEYISEQRIKKVKELLQDNSLNISDVALQAGFDSRTYFNRFIRKSTGMSPQEYRDYLKGG